MNVLSTKPAKKDGQGFVRIKLDGDDGAIIEAWTPELEKVKALGESPIPDGWTLKDGKQGGKMLLPPQEKRGSSYSQSKEAFDRSAESRRAWQLEEEDRKDRRTAVMTAFEQGPAVSDRPSILFKLSIADHIYNWLSHPRTSPPPAAGHGSGPESGGDTTSPVSSSTGGPRETEKAPEQPAPAGGPAGAPGGSSSDSPSGSSPRRSTIPANKCDHSVGVDEEGRCLACLKPMGRPA